MDEFGRLRQSARKREAAQRRSRLVAGLLANAFLGLTFLVFAAGLVVVGAAYGPRFGLNFPLSEMGLLGEVAASIAPPPTAPSTSPGGPPNPEATVGLPSPIPTATASHTPTATPSRTPTETLPPTNTPTVRPTRTPTPVRSPTFTPSVTPFGTPAPSSTVTPTPTPTEPGFPGCEPSGSSAFENTLLGLINDEREADGLPAYVRDLRLEAAARAHSSDMACNGFFSHTGSDGSSVEERVTAEGYDWTEVNENIFGTADTSSSAPQLALNFWMTGGANRANILSVSFVEVGIGYIFVPDSPFGGYFTVVFAQP